MVLPMPPNQEQTQSNSTHNGRVTNNDSGLDDDSFLLAEVQEVLGPGFEQRGVNAAQRQQRVHEGAALFRGFLDYEFRQRNLPEPAQLLPQGSSYNHIPPLTTVDVILAANQLRILCAEFSRSPLRQWVQDHARRVPIGELDFNAFSDLLYGLFQEGGVTWERVVVLFYFCTDLAARAFREQLPRQLHNIVEWSFKFFAGERIVTWIINNGGWVNVMQKSMSQVYNLAKMTFLVVGIVAFATYLWKSR